MDTLASFLSAIGSSAVATIVTMLFTTAFSRATPDESGDNKERDRLQDEVVWLRGQLDDQLDDDDKNTPKETETS